MDKFLKENQYIDIAYNDQGCSGYLCRNLTLRKMLPHVWESSCHCLGLGSGEYVEEEGVETGE